MIEIKIEKIDGIFITRKTYVYGSSRKPQEPTYALTFESLIPDLKRQLEIRDELLDIKSFQK